MTAHMRRRFGRAAITAVSLVLLAAAPLAQGKPPIPGATGVVEPEGSKTGGTAAVAAVAAGTAEGARRLLRAIGIGGGGEKDLSADAFASLQPGTMVAVREESRVGASTQEDTQTTSEARVLEVNRRTGVILIRLPDRTTARLQLVGRGARDREARSDAGQDAGGVVSLSYVDDNGERVMLSFRKVS